MRIKARLNYGADEPGLESWEFAERMYKELGKAHTRGNGAYYTDVLCDMSIQVSSGPPALQPSWWQIQGFPWPLSDVVVH